MSSPLLAGKVISVTGAGSGIGRSCAIRLAQDGAKVSLTDMSSGLLEETIELVCAVTSRENVLGRVLDIVDRQEVDAWVEETVRRFGKLDGAVNAAGVHPKESGKEPIWNVTDDDWAFAQDVNVRGTLNLVRAQLRWMVGARDEAKGDSLESRSIVVFGSICSVKGGAKLAAYTASKHAVVGLMRAAAIDAAPHDIRVNAICPGPIDTPMLRSTVDAESRDTMARSLPIQRLGEAEEVAHLASFLVSDRSKFITGSVQMIDGGQSAA